MLVTKSKPNTCSQFIEPTPEVEVYESVTGYIMESRQNTVNDSLSVKGRTMKIEFDDGKTPFLTRKGGYLSFEVTHRVDHAIIDSIEFDKCCMENLTACNGYYISSYMKGTGEYSKFRTKKVFFDLIDLSPYKLATDIAEDTPDKWSVRTKFKESDYYLYEVTPINLCYEWLSTGVPAKTLDRKYFAGHSEIMDAENISSKKSYANAAKKAKEDACKKAAKHIKLDKKGKEITCADVPGIVYQCEERIMKAEGRDAAGVLMFIANSDLPEE